MRSTPHLALCLAIVVGLSAGRSGADDFVRVEYNNPGLTADLGVGLWAWPLPIDWDSDGDLDLVVSCPDVPFNGTYLFENPGGDEKMPVFHAPRRVGAALRNVRLSMVSETPRVLTPHAEWKDFLGSSFAAKTAIDVSHPHQGEGRIRANQWHYVDYDSDGDQDLIVGVGWWGDYGWDDAFDETGRWTRGPLHGFVYLIRNGGSDERPRYDPPTKVQAGGVPIDVYGMPSPNFADFDGDGDLDIVCGEFLDGFTYFQNTGSAETPRYAAGKRLQHSGSPLAMHVQMITPTAIDWDGDDDVDLVVGDEDGRVALVEHSGMFDEDGTPQFLPPAYFQQRARDLKFGALVTPVSVDWDNDGDEDLVCGNTSGNIAVIENLGGSPLPRWARPRLLEAAGETIRIQAGPNGSIQGPCEAKWGYTTVDVADWDGDGLLDIIANSIWGKVVWYRNVGSKNAPVLAAAKPIEVEWPGSPPKPAWNWWQPAGKEFVTQWRTTPLVADWNRDGLADLIMLDHEGFLALFRRENKGGKLELNPGERVFCNSEGNAWKLSRGDAGKSGRRKMCLADWDGDGDLDLLINSTNVDLMLNGGTADGVTTLSPPTPHARQKLAGHTTSPTTVDWDGDGERELLVGAEDGRFYLLRAAPLKSVKLDADPLTIEGVGFEIAKLADGGRAFSNRNYKWFGLPAGLEGYRYTQTGGGERAIIAVSARRDAVILVATSSGGQPPDRDLWHRDEGLSFGYTDKGRSKLSVFRRELKAGERIDIPQSNWTGCLLLFQP